MFRRDAGISEPGGSLRLISTRAARLRHDRRGIILLAVLVFVALLLPLITLVLTSINTESVATAEAIKGAKAELAAEKAINDAISLVVQDKSFPSFYTSAAQPDTAIIVTDPVTGWRRDQVQDSGSPGAAGLDNQLGTDDDFWVGPRFDRSYIGGGPTVDTTTSSRMYRYDFRFPQKDGPTYLGQSWSFSTDNRAFARSPFNNAANNWIWLFNQYSAVELDTDGDGVDDGYDPADPFTGTTDAVLYGPGYYPGSDEPRVNGPGTQVNRDLADADIDQYMFNAKVNIYESIYSDLDRGPMPTNLLKSYANVSDEAGRLNLNIFCKKVRVYMPESAETDYDFDGYGTNDFNMNEQFDEAGWKWMDNPLFPDRLGTRTWDFNATAETFADAGVIDWGSIDLATGAISSTVDGVAMAEIGENVQHYYEGDTDNDGIPESVESMRESLRMLMSLPGVDGQLAANILTYLNPSLDYFTDLAADRGVAADYYNPGAPGFTTYVDPQDGEYREDACNITPPLVALEISFSGGGGVVNDFYWDFSRSDVDDLPLAPPQQLTNLDQLREIPGITDAKFERLKDHVTIFSYDTNVVANYIQDVGPDADLVNAYRPGDPQYNGALQRSVPADSRDADDVADLRYDVDRYVFGFTLADFREQAEEMYANVREHLPQPLFDKITLPAVDRLGRAGAEDHMVPNTDPRYDLSDIANPGILISHRDSNANIYNVGEFGHQNDFNGTPGAGYPALNPQFTLDSCLSIAMYRSGTFFEEDDYSYNPDNGAWMPFANRGLRSFFPFGLPWFFEVSGPFARLLSSFLEANNNPLAMAGANVDPVVRPHNSRAGDYQTLLNAGSFDSTADLLDVPLYKFSRMSVSLMADPPSDFRYDFDSDSRVDSVPEELAPVRYYLTFSDVVDLGWYLENINPDGPDNRPATGDEPDMDRVLYRLYFSMGNRPGIWPGSVQCEIPLTAMQLRAVGAGIDGSSNKITIVAWDNFNNLDVLGFQFTSSPAFTAQLGPLGATGSLERRFGWDDVPEPEANPGSDGDARPLEDGWWNTAIGDAEPTYGGPQFNNATTREAWAFDGYGDPYLTARVEVVKWDDAADAPSTPELRTDDVVQVYMQYNAEADIPFRVDTLPVRISGDQFEIRSSIGGAETDGGTYLLYDWQYAGEPTTYDGTWPVAQPGQTGDPRVIRITPSAAGVSLHVYDLRVFQDPAGPWAPAIPIILGTPNLDPLLYSGGTVSPPSGPPPPGFPADPIYGGTYPLPGTPGYATDAVTVNLIATQPEVVAQISAEEPSVFADASLVQFRAKATGGQLPYNYRLRVLDPQFGDPDSVGAQPYEGPDDPDLGLDIADWPGLGVPPRPSRCLDAAGNLLAPFASYVYDDTAGGVLATQNAAGSNNLDETFTVNPAGLGLAPGQYWVELRVIDSAGTPVSDYAYTKLLVGTDVSPSGSSGIPPNMNASINLRDLGENRKGFVASVAVDGGTGGYSYYWEIDRPVYAPTPADADEIVGMRIVDSSAPFVSIDVDVTGPTFTSTPMTSNEQNPTFEFHTFDIYNNQLGTVGADGIPDADGVYFVHCYVFDHASSAPGLASCTVAHDVAMLTISEGDLSGAPVPIGSLARTPMAVLAAYPPGNGSAEIGDNASATGGANRPYIGSINPALSALAPDVAAIGDTIVIRGFNFAAPAAVPGIHVIGNASDNIINFAGGVTARAFDVVDEGPGAIISGTQYEQLALYVRVPNGARSGFLTVTTPEGTSERVFFQTNFLVSFDLVGKLSPNDPTYLKLEVDYQGDGLIDESINTQANPDSEGVFRGFSHDYAGDGIGNYNATLAVTDLISGRKAVSHQLVMIRDLRPEADFSVTLITGTVSALGGVTPGATFTDAAVNFNAAGVRAGDQIVNLSLAPTQTAQVTAVLSPTELQCTALNGGGAWNIGDGYQVRRWLTSEGTNAMLANIWPEIGLRSETFVPTADAGVSFHSAVGGVGALGLQYKWQVDLNGSTASAIGGQLVTTNRANEVPGTANAPAISSLDNILIDTTTDFTQVGSLGVRVGDLVLNTGDPNAQGDVHRVDSPTQLTVVDGIDPSFATGLTGGGGQVRGGPGSTIDAVTALGGGLFDIEDTGYNWHGRGAAVANTGGFIVGDGNPASVGAGASFTNLTDNTTWEVVLVNIAPSVNEDIIRVRQLGPGNGQRFFNVVNVTDLGGAPPRQILQSSINWTQFTAADLMPGGIGALVYIAADDSVWQITDVPVELGGTIAGPNHQQSIQVDYVSGPTMSWDPTPTQGYIILAPQWLAGDEWQASFPANQFRVNNSYAVYSEGSSGSGGSAPKVDAWADALYATQNAPIDFNISLTTPFDLDASLFNPSVVGVDWDGAGGPTEFFSVGTTTRLDGGTNGMEVESVEITHIFVGGEPDPGTGWTRARIYVYMTPRGQASQVTYGPYSLPAVRIGQDDYDADLTTLNLANWDNNLWHKVTLETTPPPLNLNFGGSVPGTITRRYFASDQLLVPPGMDNYADTLATWVSYTKPFFTSNATGITTMRHQAVHGMGSALNWMSDANADARWRPQASESPQGANPVNYHQFAFQNGSNEMNVSGAAIIRGASFPAAVPGVGRVEASGIFNYYRGNRGVYNGLGFVTDNLPPDERAFVFDSQAVFWGDRLNGQDTERRPLAADFAVDPLIGSNSQLVQLTSFVTGGNSFEPTYTYQWFIEKFSGTSIGFVGLGDDYAANGNVSSTAAFPTFNPVEDILDEGWYAGGDDGSGRYWIWLRVGDGSGNYATCRREFRVVAPTLAINVMADPPSASTGDAIQYFIFIDGGRPGYTVTFDWDSNVNPGIDATLDLEEGNEAVVSTQFLTPGVYVCQVEVTDDAGSVDTDVTQVEIAETIPLNCSLLVNPPSGVAPFILEVNYSVSGGRRLSGGGYNVTVQLVNTDGEAQPAVNRTDANTFGPNGIPDDPRLPSPINDDDPVLLTVPAAGNYYVQLLVTDNDGRVDSETEDVFATGYLTPSTYGQTAPQVVRDAEGRPMHAVRIWTDPFLNQGGAAVDGYENVPGNDLEGGRLLEADLQVMGDTLMTDPNPNFRSFGVYATEDPLTQPLYYADYSLAESGEEQVQDFYDTYTLGRININTASEEVLTALFMRIIKERAYIYNQQIDLNDDGTDEDIRVMRDPLNDEFLTEAEARTLAQKVIRYRTLYFDLHKPDVGGNGAGSSFGYQGSAYNGLVDLGDPFRVDHLPVIGPWDGVNPHDYAVDDRNAILRDCDEVAAVDGIHNAYDHAMASFYNFDPTTANGAMFYSPSDIAVIRDRWEANVSVLLPGGQSFNLAFREPESNYAKYLNDVAMNGLWGDDRAGSLANWITGGPDPYQVDGGDNYSRWAFDARNYFTYSAGQLNVLLDASSGTPSLSISPAPGTQGLPEDARNNIAIIDSNGETAYTYIANPPFRSLYDLYKVIDDQQSPATFPLDSQGSYFSLRLDANSFTPFDNDYPTSPTLYQTFSGPSVFKYVARWDDENCEFIPIANFLDDIAPYVTCRSYVFRVDAAGAVETSGGTEGALVDTSTIQRDRGKSAVIDVGPLWSRRVDTLELDDVQRSQGLKSADRDVSYRILWYKDDRD